MSPSSASASSEGAQKTKASLVGGNASGAKSPRPGTGPFQHPEPVSSPKPKDNTNNTNSEGSFQAFAQSNPAKADELVGKLIEVTGLNDRATIYKAFDQSKKTDQNNEFNVTHAIEWFLTLSESNQVPSDMEQQQRTRRKTPVQSQFVSPAPSTNTPSNAAATVAAAVNNHSYAPMQPPNSPSATGSGGGDVLRPNAKPLVDLTDSSNDAGTNKAVDTDLEKAIQLSLQEVKRADGGGGGNIGVTQEEQDVSRALEASLMENQFGGKRSRGLIDYADPLNPHDRERNGMVRFFFTYRPIPVEE